MASIADDGQDTRNRGLDALPAREWVGVAVVIAVALTLMATWPFLGDGIPAGHDADFHLARIESIYLGLREGTFPVRLYEMQGYGMGYPCGVCYPDAFLYIPAVLRLVGLSLRASYTAFVMLANLATAGIALFSFTKMFGSRTRGVVCSVLWTLAPYRLFDLLVRAAVGEWLAMAFMPGVLLGVWAIRHADERGWSCGWLWLGSSMAGVASSHILSVPICCALCVPFLLWGLVTRRDILGRQLIALAKAVGVATALCIGFMIPFASYYTGHDLLVKHAVSNPLKKALYPSQLLSGFLPFKWVAESGSPYTGGLPIQVGLALVLGLVATGLAVVAPSLSVKSLPTDTGSSGGTPLMGDGRRRGSQRAEIAFVAVVCLGLMLASTRLFPWARYGTGGILGTLVSATGTIQFPWRLLATVSLLLVMLWGMALREADSHLIRMMSVVAVAVALAECQYATGSFSGYMVRCEGYDDVTQAHVASGAEYLPACMDKMAFREGTFEREPVVSDDKVSVTMSESTAQSWTVRLESGSSQPETATLPILWHDQLRATDADGRKIEMEPAEGRVLIHVPARFSGTVEIRFTEPLVWRLSEVVSGIGLAGVVALYALHAKQGDGTVAPSAGE